MTNEINNNKLHHITLEWERGADHGIFDVFHLTEDMIDRLQKEEDWGWLHITNGAHWFYYDNTTDEIITETYEDTNGTGACPTAWIIENERDAATLKAFADADAEEDIDEED